MLYLLLLHFLQASGRGQLISPIPDIQNVPLETLLADKSVPLVITSPVAQTIQGLFKCIKKRDIQYFDW